MVVAAAAFTVVVAAANCGWLRLATMVAIGCCSCCCRLVSWLVGWLVGCLVVVVVVCLVGGLIYALTRIQKAKIYFKNGISFHICTHREREREKGKTCLATLALQQQQEQNLEQILNIIYTSRVGIKERKREQDICII